MRDPRGGPGQGGGPSVKSGTCRGTLGEVQHRLGDSRGVSGRVGQLRDGSGDPRGDPVWVGRPSRWSGKGRETLGDVCDGSGVPRGGPGRVGGPGVGPRRLGGPLGRSETSQVIHEVVRDGSRDPRGGLGRVEGPSERSGTGRGTQEEVRDGWRTWGRSAMGCGTLGVVRDRSRDPRGIPGLIGGPSGRSGMGRRTLDEVRYRLGRCVTGRRTLGVVKDESGDPRGGLR